MGSEETENVAQPPQKPIAEQAIANTTSANSRKQKFLEKYDGDLGRAERDVAKQLDYTKQLPGIAIGLMLVIVGFFLPHSGRVLGFDVLFNSPTAQQYGTTIPERIYSWLAVVGGVLLSIGTIVSRSWLVAWVNWAGAGIGWWYSIIAIWMRQSRPPTDPGGPPSYGLITVAVGMTLLFVSLTWVLFRRSALQKAVARARREAAMKNDQAEENLRLERIGLPPVQTRHEPEDDRRARVKERRARRETRIEGASGTGANDTGTGATGTGDTGAS